MVLKIALMANRLFICLRYYAVYGLLSGGFIEKVI